MYILRLCCLVFVSVICGAFSKSANRTATVKAKEGTFLSAQAWAQNDKQAIAQLLSTSTPITWLFTGNSITQGAKHTHGYRGYPEIFSERVRFEMGRSRDIVVNTAISGHTTKHILDDFAWRVAKLRPKVVILMIGTNDAATANQISVPQYSNNLSELITRIRTLGAIPILLSPTPIRADLATERSTLESYVDAMKDVAGEKQVIFVDNWSIWNTEMATKYNGQVPRNLLNDPLHPNGQGHKEIAMSLFKELSVFDATTPTGGAPYYEGEH